MRITKILALALVAIVSASAALAQNATMTPYSRYGYGMLSDNATSMQRGMGGVGYAMNSGRQINVMNPASYAAIDSLTFLFDMGVNFDMLWSQEGKAKEDNFSGGLDYITMSFPITKWLGASLGMLPFSSTGYAFGDNIDNGSVKRSGSGGLSQLYGGLGINPGVKGLYVGANVAYLFGSTINDVYAYTNSGSTSVFERYMRVRDYRVDIGAQYSLQVNTNHRVTLGVTYSPGKKMHGETFGIFYDATVSSKPDTVGMTKLNGRYTMPATYGAGLSYSWRNRLMVEADVTYQPWKDAKYAPIEDFEVTKFCDRVKCAVGAEFTPQPRGSYLQMMHYRAGAYLSRDYLTIKGNNLWEAGVTLGLGLPVPGFKSEVNLGFEYKRRQARPNPLIKEQYFNITLGVNFNEMWFRKSKIY